MLCFRKVEALIFLLISVTEALECLQNLLEIDCIIVFVWLLL